MEDADTDMNYFAISENYDTFALLNQKVYHLQCQSQDESTQARMAESVDALVSNTSGAIRAGSIPAPGTQQNASA